VQPNVREFVKIVTQVHNFGPVLELGSCLLEGQDCDANLRSLFPSGTHYIGVDMNPGRGVDVIAYYDHTYFPTNIEFIPRTVIACETFEHCDNPRQAIENVGIIIHSSGVFIFSSPFNFPIHHLPDRWRITPQCYQEMLEGSGFYAAVYFQGELSNPHSVYGFATCDQDKFGIMESAISYDMHQIPAINEGESVYRWNGQQDYIRARQEEQAKCQIHP
jgi:hypothetical protein